MKTFLQITLFMLFPILVFCQGFTTNNTTGNLIDANGNNFIMKGMNVPLAWYVGNVNNSIDDLRKNTNSNCLRIVVQTNTPDASWQTCVDNCIKNNIIPMVELHDVTGNTDQNRMVDMAKYWASKSAYLTRPDIAKYILINICNEWGTWETANSNGTAWRDATINSIKVMREAGIKTTIVCDAVGYGQDIDDAKNIRAYAKTIQAADAGYLSGNANLLFSIHMYCEWRKGGDNIGIIKTIKDSGIPIIVGEFGYQHASDGSCDIDEQLILNTCQTNGIGWLAWSQKGNGSPVEYLDLCSDWECTSLSAWGNTIINGTNGTKTATTCSVFLTNVIAPTISITSPTTGSTFTAPASITINATAADADGTIASVAFYNGTTLLNSDETAPYSFIWTNVSKGSYAITAVAKDNSGNTTTSTVVSVNVNVPQAPYLGTAWAIPGKIEFENYDVGGNGVAYFDGTVGNSVTPAPAFRADEDVDVENCTDAGTGYNIGYAMNGEWLEYTVNVAASGVYSLTFRAACNGAGRTISLSSDGIAIANNIAIPNTAGWQVWTDVKTDVTLSAGQHVLRLTIGALDYVNLNYMTFALATTVPPTVTTPVIYCQETSATALTATGTALKWYTAATGGTALTSAPVPSTSSVGSTTYYVSQTLNNIESSRASIIVTVNASPSAPTVNSPVTYSVGQSATALTAIGTALKWFTSATMETGSITAPTPSTATEGTTNYYVSQTVNSCESPRASIAVVVGQVQTVSLKAGWNIIGCPIEGSTDIAKALSSVWQNTECVKNLSSFWLSSNTIPALNSLSKLNWGEGYLIKVSKDCNLDWIIR